MDLYNWKGLALLGAVVAGFVIWNKEKNAKQAAEAAPTTSDKLTYARTKMWEAFYKGDYPKYETLRKQYEAMQIEDLQNL